MSRTVFGGVGILTVVLATQGVVAASIPEAVAPDRERGTLAHASDTAVHVWVVAPEGNEARYRVREQLARINFPSDAVGTTSAVEGRIVIQPDGSIDADASWFAIDLTTLESDSDRRDNFIRRNTLETETYPEARFVPTAFDGLSGPIPGSGEVSFGIIGTLTVHGVTRPARWDVAAELVGDAILGRATTRFTFGDHGMTIPRVGSVLSVNDDIRLEYDFILIREPAADDEAHAGRG